MWLQKGHSEKQLILPERRDTSKFRGSTNTGINAKMKYVYLLIKQTKNPQNTESFYQEWELSIKKQK